MLGAQRDLPAVKGPAQSVGHESGAHLFSLEPAPVRCRVAQLFCRYSAAKITINDETANFPGVMR